MTADRVGLFLADIAGVPSRLADLARAWETAGPPRFAADVGDRRLRFVGLGSSRFAALVVAAELADRGVRAPVDWASSPGPTAPDELLFAISSSGRTPEVVDAARRHAAAGGTALAVTNVEASPLARVATATLALMAGTEQAGIACATFRATVAVLGLATGVLQPPEIHRLAQRMRDTLAARNRLEAGVETIASAESVDVIGDGRSIGALEQAALMLREGPRLRAAAWDAGDWLHTGVYTALPGHGAVLFSGTPYDQEISDTITRRGGAVVTLPAFEGPIEAALSGLTEVEVLAAEIWGRAVAEER